jgi:hypothetical protein
MPHKIRLIDRNVLEPHDSLPQFQFQDAIDEEEGIAMREELLNLVDIHHRSSLFGP